MTYLDEQVSSETKSFDKNIITIFDTKPEVIGSENSASTKITKTKNIIPVYIPKYYRYNTNDSLVRQKRIDSHETESLLFDISSAFIEDQNKELSSVSQYINIIEEMIHKNYRGVDSIEYNVLKDPEVFGLEQICFEINITGNTDDIIVDQKRFYKSLIKLIPSDKRRLLTFTYRVF